MHYICFVKKINSILFITIFGFIFFDCYAITPHKRIDSLKTELSKSNLSAKVKVELIYNLSTAYYSANDLTNAMDYSRMAIFSYELMKDPIGKASAMRQCGNIYSDINDYQNSLKNYLNALEIFQTYNNAENIAKTKKDIISLYLKMENYDKALEYLWTNLSHYKKDSILNKNEIINTYFNLGISYGGKEVLDSSLYFFQKCFNYYSENNNDLQEAGLLNNIGAIYSKLDKNQKALNKYKEALTLFTKINNETGIGVTISNIAFIYMKQKNYNAAIEYYVKSIELFNKTGALHYLNNTYLNLSEIYKQENKFDSALHYNELYIQLNDSLKNNEVLSRIADLEVQHKLSNKEKELKILEKEKLLIEQENKIKKIRVWILAGIIIFILVIAVLVLRNLKISLQRTKLKKDLLEHEKNLLKDELSFKDSELEQLALRIVQKNNFLEEIKNKFEELSLETENNKKINEISSNIDHNLYIDSDRKELELKIDHIHQTFLYKLSQKFPDLTKTEKRLCSLLVLDISSKDMATILNISPDSVKKSRYRLRKKLGIDSEELISDYLKNI